MKTRAWFLLVALIFALLASSVLAEVPADVEDLPLLINHEYGLPEGYKPKKLVNLYDHKRSFKLADSDIRVEKHVFEAMNEMFAAAKKDKVSDYIVTSGYRTKKRQTQIYKADKQGVAAKPGFSEHQTGLAFDVVTPGEEGKFHKTKQFRWLRDHCAEYGFILRYPEGKEDITGIVYESWHYRYVGVAHAEAMQESGETLEEYVARLSAEAA